MRPVLHRQPLYMHREYRHRTYLHRKSGRFSLFCSRLFVPLHVEMRRVLHIFGFLSVQSIVLLAVLFSAKRVNSVPAEESFHRWESMQFAQTHPAIEATLTSVAQIYRICSSRPQRVTPTHGTKSLRVSGTASVAARRNNVSPLESHYDSRCRLETSPFSTSASRQYYVIALRHILC